MKLRTTLIITLLALFSIVAFSDQMVFTVGKGKKYHHVNCRYVRKGKNRGSEIRKISISEAKRWNNYG